ncbi:hypothetical protein EJF36_04515 [Bacillus sp. HMF5848]|uniref:FAD/NAD(P)-binding protein n=1 Tax=Bacillus sp. HMF5848 TaxID=2495421 RepID=UPI000F77AF9C|nr:FAD/NAD(P)-binding protein [Bacillus sp. HMF5848]RSK26181.1 hypothetical protein EJF36_04515 [Bacillus sp. HMF5848]
MYDWLIIGGGIHGCTVAVYLIKSKIATTEQIRIVDPYKEPLHLWRKNTERIGMKYLRSPFVHHIDVDAFSLTKFAKKHKNEDFYGPYKRPSLELFNEHCMEIMDAVSLHNMWHCGLVKDISKGSGCWRVDINNGESLLAKNVVLSISLINQPMIPDWIQHVRNGQNVAHIFDENVKDLTDFEPPIIVVGGGITAAHTCITLSELFPGNVTLLTRHDLRVHDFDSDPGWLGPKYMTAFHKVNDYGERRKMIQKARYKGSMPKELYNKLSMLVRTEKLKIVIDEVIDISNDERKHKFNLSKQQFLEASSIILTTGFEPTMPKQDWLHRLITAEKLACASCGFPIVKESLEWCKNLYVTGPLAELELGPTARNISGARKAAERIVLHSVV